MKPTYGIFVWNEEGIYPASKAIKTYKSEKTAIKTADKLNDENPVHVVRTINTMTQVEHLVFSDHAYPKAMYLRIVGNLPQSWKYNNRDSFVPLNILPGVQKIDWTEIKDDATEIPVGQVEDLICWLHQYTQYICDRTTRTRTVAL